MFELDKELTDHQKEQFLASVHDRMTEFIYPEPMKTFQTNVKPEVSICI